jgi:hypothetical protein
MNEQWPEYQKVNIGRPKELCVKCGTNILNVSNFKYTGKFTSDTDYREELCTCRKCDKPFIIRYDLFDKKGHIFSRVFTGDVNDPKHQWHDNLTEAQKEKISKHLEGCELCQTRLSEEILSDAWFGNTLKNM